jgi:hypothetical protein
MFEIDNYNNAVSLRNSKWESNSNIPSWVDINTVGLDQFFTVPEVAENYYQQLLNFLKQKNINIKNCVFIEPSAGAGSFFNLLPKNNSIGLDIYPISDRIIQQDFLSWEPPIEIKNKIKIFVGNPPFGYRGWLALSFMNYASKFADYIAFILPMSFQSEGKGSPKNRVKGMKLNYSEIVPLNSFINPLGKIEKVNALWQIWEKGENIQTIQPTCKEWVEIFTVDMRKERLCGMTKMGYADYFLQRTFYNNPPSLVKDFSEVKYVCGYGLIFKKDKRQIKEILNSTNWVNYSNLAAHNCRHISMYHIEKVLTDNKLTDGRL